ncbi:hypothetical protein C3L33_08287, partial [Rhododendron williamsianum]
MEGDDQERAASSTKERRRKFKRICVFCGSRAGHKSAFSDAALQLGNQLVERKIDLVYGGGSVGLMGLISKTVFNGGGYGTMEELLEVIAWSQLGIHEKPVGLLNVDGYYNSLLALFDKGVEEGFIQGSARQIVVSADTPEELINKMEEYVPVHDRVAPRQSWEVDQLLESTTGGEA